MANLMTLAQALPIAPGELAAAKEALRKKYAEGGTP